MEYTSEFDNKNNICTVRVTGKYHRPDDSDELKHLAVKIHYEHEYRLFLFDMTQVEIIPTNTFATFYAANPQGQIAEELRKFKVAFVRQEIDDNDHFFETVAVNRGFQLRAFDRFDDAIEWLKHSK